MIAEATITSYELWPGVRRFRLDTFDELGRPIYGASYDTIWPTFEELSRVDAISRRREHEQ